MKAKLAGIGRISLIVVAFMSLPVVTLMGAIACQGSQVTSGHDGSLWEATSGIVSSNSGPNPLLGLSINQIVGANRFYNEGYSGTRAIATVLEAGAIWNGHETLQHVTQFFDARATYIANGVGYGQLGETGWHATMVGHVLGGRETSPNQEYQKGIAYGATLWSGAIATHYNGPPPTSNFGFTHAYALTDPLAQSMLTGVNGRTTDVVNLSWGFSVSANPMLSGGNYWASVTLDGMARQSRATVVAIAGNHGPANNTLVAPGNGYNSIVVGALGSDTSSPAYTTISEFSSRGPQLYIGPDGNFGNVRARVDITAPGQNMTLALYGGTTGGNTGGIDPTAGATNQYWPDAAGTSFASPTVAGGATLLADVAYDRFSANAANARDGQVIKAVLLNSAAKPVGWNNGQTLVNGVMTTHQSLDYTYGAGMLDLNQAFDQYVGGTTDVAGFSGGSIEEVGWDYGIINENSTNDYFFADLLLGGTTFNATLNWFVGRTWVGTDSFGNVTTLDEYFTDLCLELWSVQNGLLDSLIAQSNAAFINTEHFSFLLPETGEFALRVSWIGERYDFVGNPQQTYGLAWQATAIPEPSTMLMLLPCTLYALVTHRRRQPGAKRQS